MNKRRTAGLPFIFVTLVLDMIGLGIIIPVVPELVGQLAGGGTSAARNLGVLIALYALAQLLAAPALGTLSDRFGRRPILLSGALLAAVSYALAALAPSLGWLFLARALGGVAGATVGVANAYIADVSTPENRARNFGLAGAAFGLGLIIGPALGGLLGGLDLRLPFIASACLATLNLLYGLLVLPESRRGVPAPFDPRALVPLRALGVLGRFPGVPALAAVTVLATLATQFLTSTWVLHGAARYGWNAGTNGVALTVAGLLGVLVQVVLLPRVLGRLGNGRTIEVAIVLGAVGNVLYGLAAQGWMLYVAMVVASLGGLGGPPLQALVAGKVSPEAQGAVQGAFGGLAALCAVVGPLVATALFAHFTAPHASPALPGVAFFAASLFLLISLAVFRLVTAQPTPRGELA